MDSKYLKGKAEVLPIQGAFNGIAQGRGKATSTYYPGVFTNPGISQQSLTVYVYTVQQPVCSRTIFEMISYCHTRGLAPYGEARMPEKINTSTM